MRYHCFHGGARSICTQPQLIMMGFLPIHQIYIIKYNLMSSATYLAVSGQTRATSSTVGHLLSTGSSVDLHTFLSGGESLNNIPEGWVSYLAIRTCLQMFFFLS